MNAEESLGRLDREDLRNDCPPVTALRNVLLIAQLQHQFVKRGGHPGGTPAARLRIAREAVARHCRKDEVEGIVGASAVCRGVCKRIDDLQKLDDRAGPPVGHEQRHGVVVRSEEHTSELQSIMRNSYAVLCLKKK